VGDMSLRNKLGRAVGIAAAAAAIGGLGVTGVASASTVQPAAPASMNGCRIEGGSCITIEGKGTYVQYVIADDGELSFSPFVGHFEITGPGIDVNGPDHPIPGDSAQDEYMRVDINRNLPNNSRICATTWEKVGSGWSLFGRACGTVHS